MRAKRQCRGGGAVCEVDDVVAFKWLLLLPLRKPGSPPDLGKGKWPGAPCWFNRDYVR